MTKFIAILILTVSLTLTGCSSKFAYDNLDWWVYWYVDDYVELNDSQEAAFDNHLESWRRWHKSSELPRYKQQLVMLKTQLKNSSLDTNAILEHYGHAQVHWQRVRDKVSPPLAKLALTLSDEQVVMLFAQLEKENQEEEEEHNEYMAKSAEERQQERIERLVETVEERIGDINPDQHEIIATYSEQFTSTGEYWIAYRRTVQQAARRLFVTKHSNDNFVADLLTLIQNPDEYRSEAYKSARANNRTVMATMASEIASTLTDEQKDELLENLNDLIETVEDFMK